MTVYSNTELITAIYDLLVSLVADGEIKTTAVVEGGLTVDLTSTNTKIDALLALISAGKFLTTETSAADIKTATEALAAIILDGKLLTTETSAADIKTAVQALAAIISGGKLLTTETSAADIKTAVETLITAPYAKKKVLSAAGTRTGSGEVTVSGTAIQVTNLSDTAGMSFTVGGIEVTLDVNEPSPVFDTVAFTAVTFTQSTGMVCSYKVWS